MSYLYRHVSYFLDASYLMSYLYSLLCRPIKTSNRYWTYHGSRSVRAAPPPPPPPPPHPHTHTHTHTLRDPGGRSRAIKLNAWFISIHVPHTHWLLQVCMYSPLMKCCIVFWDPHSRLGSMRCTRISTLSCNMYLQLLPFLHMEIFTSFALRVNARE